MRDLVDGDQRGPLRPILQPVGQDAAGPSPTIAVIDHDLNEQAFWIDHGIANLRYYPTAKPSLARVIAECLIKDKLMADPLRAATRVLRLADRKRVQKFHQRLQLIAATHWLFLAR